MTSKHGRKASSASPSTAAKKAAKAEAHQKAVAARRAGKAEAHLKKARDSVIALLDDKRLPEEAKARLLALTPALYVGKAEELAKRI